MIDWVDDINLIKTFFHEKHRQKHVLDSLSRNFLLPHNVSFDKNQLNSHIHSQNNTQEKYMIINKKYTYTHNITHEKKSKYLARH